MTASPLQLRVLAGDRVPADVHERWAELWTQSGDHPTPFLHPRATATVASVVPDVAVAVVSQGDQDVAFLPFERRGRDAFPIGHDVSQGDGMLVAPGVEIPMVKVLRRCRLRSLVWFHRDVGPSPLARYEHTRADAAMVDISQGYERYAERISADSSVVTQAGRKKRKLGREVGDVTFELLDDHDLARELVERKSAQLAERGHPTPDVDATRRLIEAYGRTWSGDGFWSALSVLRAGDRIVAMNWGIVGGGRFVSGIPWYDDALGRYSPGLLLHIELLRDAHTIDTAVVDLGLGLDQTKLRLMTHTSEMGAGKLWTSFAGRAYRSARTFVEQRREDG